MGLFLFQIIRDSLRLNKLRVDAYFNKALLVIRVGNKDGLEPFSFFADENLQIKKEWLPHMRY